MRPAEVWGLAIRPSASRSDMPLRMVAGESSRPDARESVREPTGWPSAMYRSTRALSNNLARSSSIMISLHGF